LTESRGDIPKLLGPCLSVRDDLNHDGLFAAA
jgi:hypothetical protein